MRVKNKEIRQRRHRKEQKIKDAAREVRAQFADKKPGEKPVAKAPVKAKAAPAAKPAPAPKKAPAASAEAKTATPKKAATKKKADTPPEGD